MNSTFISFTFGCRVNQAEKETLDRELIRMGFIYSTDNPQYFIINTCAVTNKAEREAKQLIYQTKRKNPKTIVVVTGCAATKWIKEGRKIEGVDLAIDNINKEFIAELLFSKFSRKFKSKKVDNQTNYKNREEYQILEVCTRKHTHNIKSENSAGNIENYHFNKTIDGLSTLQAKKFDIQTVPNKFQNSGRYYLKIQDGCHRFCTFCIVPYLRGQPKSERIRNLVLKIKNLDDNIKEVILTAINTQAFGYDTGESFITLINRIIEVTKIPRISLGSVHPWSINDEFFDLYKSTLTHERLVKFFHIPLQSGSDKILAYMKRGYKRKEFLEKLKILENIHPFTFIGTDIITGFLEETDKDFRDTYDFLTKSPISKFHVFRFSKRDKTAAYFMSKRLKEPTPAQKAKRSKALIELSRIKYHKFLEKHTGHVFSALCLEKRTDGFQEALLNNQVPVLVKSNQNVTGEIIDVQVTNYRKGRLAGVLHR